MCFVAGVTLASSFSALAEEPRFDYSDEATLRASAMRIYATSTPQEYYFFDLAIRKIAVHVGLDPSTASPENGIAAMEAMRPYLDGKTVWEIIELAERLPED
jgi:hypothetical protein